MESLPREILEDIFKLLNLKTILNLTLVCKKFNEIISKSWYTITHQDVIVIHCHSDYWLKRVVNSDDFGFTTLERKCPKLKLYGFSDIEDYVGQKQRSQSVLRVLRICGINITSLKIPDGEISLDIFNEILKAMPNLGTLTFGKFAELRFHVLMDAIEQQQLMNLRTLKFTYATSSCLEIFSKVKNVETVKLVNYSAFLKRYYEPGCELKSVAPYMDIITKKLTRRSQFIVTYFRDFLINQEKLKCLELINFPERKFFKYILKGKFKFNLEVFIFKFEENQNNLETNFFDVVIESILSMKSLQTLELEFSIQKFFSTFPKSNANVTSLKLSVGYGNSNHFRIFLDNFIKSIPNLKRLSIETRKYIHEFPNLEREDICYLNDLHSLEELSIKRCSLDTMTYSTLPCLVSLAMFIDHDHLLVDHSENFMHFLGRHPRIRILKFESDYYLTEEVLEKILCQKPFLEILKIPVYSLEAVQIITDNCENLTEIYLNMKHCFQDKKCVTTIRSIVEHLKLSQFNVRRDDKYLIAIKIEEDQKIVMTEVMPPSQSVVDLCGKMVLLPVDKTFSELSAISSNDNKCQCICCQIS